MTSWTIKKLLGWTESYFSDHDIDSPRLTAEILLAHVLDVRRLDLYLQHDRPLEIPELTAFKALIQRRKNREPVAYITGEKGFFNDTFKVARGVLIPRPDTEVLVETAIAFLSSNAFAAADPGSRPARVMELGVGSGAIIVSIAGACPGHCFFGCDISSLALATARDNARALAGDAIGFFQGSWLDAVNPCARFDLIVSNPPYIPTADIQGLAPEITRHEPDLALDGGREGLDAFRVILDQAGAALAPGGQLMLEMGFDQKPAMQALARKVAWIQGLEFKKDLAGHNRLAIFKK